MKNLQRNERWNIVDWERLLFDRVEDNKKYICYVYIYQAVFENISPFTLTRIFKTIMQSISLCVALSACWVLSQHWASSEAKAGHLPSLTPAAPRLRSGATLPRLEKAPLHCNVQAILIAPPLS